MNIILTPVVAFAIFLVILLGLWGIGHVLSAKERFKREGKVKAYACGENVPGRQPPVSYEEFFAFAMYFTILHVTALVVGTVPRGVVGPALLFLAVVAVSLVMLMNPAGEEREKQ